MKFTKKPVTVEAMQMPTDYDQEAVRQIAVWMVDNGLPGADVDVSEVDDQYVHGNVVLPEFGTNFLDIETLEGTMTARLGDWIIRGVQGEFYPCKPEIFEQTYDQADTDTGRPREHHVTITQAGDEPGPVRISIDGQDFSQSIYSESLELVTVGAHTQFPAAGLRLTLALSRLDIDGDTALGLTTANLAEWNERVKAMTTWPAWCSCGSADAVALTPGDHLSHSADCCRIVRPTSDQEADRA